MDLTFTQEDEHFRAEVAEWMRDNLAGEFACVKGRGGPGDEHVLFDERRAWEKRLAEGGWTCVAWPVEYGGRDLSLMQQVIFFEEYARAGGPGRVGHIGETLLGPTLIAFGSEEQKRRFLPPIVSGDELWCQGYSEPNAGSDLANVQTRAVLDGDHWVINGQKSFTSCAHFADYIWFAARTDPHAKKHKGISLFLLDIDTPGIEITPVYTIGGVRTNSTFYDNVRVHESRLVGEENQGWKYMTAQLDLERIALCPASPLTRRIEDTIQWARQTKIDGVRVIDKPGVRETLSELIAHVEVLKLFNLQVAERLTLGMPVYAEASTVKAYGSDLYQRVNNTLMDILGPFGHLERGCGWAPLGGALPGYFRRDLVLIFGGGAIEVQKNIIAMAGLFMPRSM